MVLAKNNGLTLDIENEGGNGGLAPELVDDGRNPPISISTNVIEVNQ